jgi:hypothetical protein
MLVQLGSLPLSITGIESFQEISQDVQYNAGN